MIETHDHEIDGAVYTITQLPARRALRLQAKLIKMFGAALGQLFLVNKQDDSNLIKCLESLSLTINEKDFEDVCMELMEGVRKNGIELNKHTIDLEFAGDMAGLYKVLLQVLKVNFENFFSMIGIGGQSMPIPATATTKKTFTKI